MKATPGALASAFLILVLGVGMVAFLSPSVRGYSGLKIDLFSQFGSHPIPVGTLITLYAHVTYNNVSVQSVLVSFQVINPQGETFFIAVGATNASGYATTSFNMSQHSFTHFPSTWTAIATTSPAQKTVSDTMQFVVYVQYIVGGISLFTPQSIANATAWTLFVDIIFASALIVFTKLRKNQNRQSNIS